MAVAMTMTMTVTSTAVICLKWRVAAKKPFNETKKQPLKITTVKVINKRKTKKKDLPEKQADSALSVSETLILS